MAAYLDPKTGKTIGYQETKGTTAEPFNVPLLWQASSLSYVTLSADASGNLLVSGGGGGGGGTQYVDGTTQATPTGTVAMGRDPSNIIKTVSLDGSGNLNVNLAAGSITGGNAAASPTGAAIPGSAGYTGYNSGGTLVGVSTANPLPVAQQGSVAVTGTFWQATQPVSGSVSVGNFPATQAVSGTVSVGNFPATQAVTQSGAWTTAISGTVPVSGTFFQATQPVSIASMPSTPVTGTFWQATQPVSIAAPIAVTQSGTWTEGRTWNLSSATDSVAITGSLTTSTPTTPTITQDDDAQYDDDGYRYVNPNVPGADIATGDKQSTQISQLAQLLTSPGIASNAVAVSNFPAAQFAANTSLEAAGNLQSIADTMALVLTELRVISAAITQLGQPVQDGPEQLRNDYTLLN
jgi:hypothetical protein